MMARFMCWLLGHHVWRLEFIELILEQEKPWNGRDGLGHQRCARCGLIEFDLEKKR